MGFLVVVLFGGPAVCVAVLAVSGAGCVVGGVGYGLWCLLSAPFSGCGKDHDDNSVDDSSLPSYDSAQFQPNPPATIATYRNENFNNASYRRLCTSPETPTLAPTCDDAIHNTILLGCGILVFIGLLVLVQRMFPKPRHTSSKFVIKKSAT